jgi:hypothetical protein
MEALLPYRNATKIFLPIFHFEKKKKHFILQNINQSKSIGKFSYVTYIGPSLTGIDYLKGRLGLPSLKRVYSEKGLGKYISEVIAQPV